MLDMGKTSENRICSSLCFSRTSGLCIAVLVLSLVITFHVSFGLSPFLLSIPILVLSTMFIVTFKKKRVILDDNPMQDEDLICDQKILHGKEVRDTLHEPLLETASQIEATRQQENGLMQEYQDESLPDILFSSDSESSNDSIIGENFDLKLMSSNYMEQDEAISDVSVSDEDDDSLIEISLPGSKSGGLDHEEPKQKPQYSNIHDLLPDSIFQQQSLMELLTEINEMNEEENLIEIDLSKGPHQMFKVRD
ncbi:hypothetical protein I3760_12G134500 [Carya illinoinensis]|uniref:Transmembrane protein n=1 Tax=Carya illinoinensis TaxID=32201 RepID=A0A922DK84_CARIL|nr:uncharacterized protein LOC122289123 [Carya illinoinensis]KAG2678241.1 hypothetical protein I3760_12G134500 [Carya illinoinensis]KAG6685924.1 hypothetical protein I3842_12G136400 [Carya illinoinensis]